MGELGLEGGWGGGEKSGRQGRDEVVVGREGWRHGAGLGRAGTFSGATSLSARPC